MPEKTQIRSSNPFGSNTKRFETTGIHPKRLVPGTFIQCRSASCNEIGPGAYDITTRDAFSKQSVCDRSEDGAGWARQIELEKLAKIPHLLYREQFEKKQYLKTNLGPGSYTHEGTANSNARKPRSCLGMITTLSPRFPRESKFNNPGPGTYGEGGIPHTAIELKSKKAFSRVGSLDAASGRVRTLPTVGSHLAPGTYERKGMIDELMAKKCGDRGPYDIFSLDRNKPIITGHYAQMKGANLGPGQYSFKSGVEEMLSSNCQSKKGVFGKHAQYPERPSERIIVTSLTQWPKPPDFPGPATYDPSMPGTWPCVENRSERVAFNTVAPRSDKRTLAFFTGNFNSVGPGRNDLHKWEEARYINGHGSVFRSETQRQMPLEKEMALRERLRAKNIDPADRTQLVN